MKKVKYLVLAYVAPISLTRHLHALCGNCCTELCKCSKVSIRTKAWSNLWYEYGAPFVKKWTACCIGHI